MTRYAMMTTEEAEVIKARLWEGEMTVALGEEFGISQGTVSNIKTGRQYTEAKWPDGTMGGMPDYRRIALRKSKHRDTSIQRRLGGSNVPIDPELVKLSIESFGCTPEEFYQRGLKALQEKRTADQIARMNELARNVEEKFKDAPPTPPKPVYIDDGSSDPAKQDKLSWDQVMELGGHMPIVQVADVGDDEDLRSAIAVAMKLTFISRSIWNDPMRFLKLVNEIKQRFINYREKLSTGN